MSNSLQELKIITKLVAAGNDFLFLESPAGAPRALTGASIRKVCDRHFGIGADGLVVMQLNSDSSTTWHFYNNDGSKAAMCGNAARAAAAWLNQRGRKFPHQLQTEFGTVVLNVLSADTYSAEVNFAARPLMLRRIGPEAVLINTGVPHVVLEVENEVLKMSDKNLALPHRWPQEAGAGGANVTFFRRLTPDSIEAATFERGVEDFTLSCGTGVLAAAVVASSIDPSAASAAGQWPATGIVVRNPGGQLKVFAPNFPRSLVLVGPALAVFQTSYAIEI